MRILVTGAAGDVGAVVAKGLMKRHRVRGHDRVAMPHIEDAWISDLADFDALLKATEGMDAVAHIGGCAGGDDWEEILQSNIIGTHNVFEACRQNGVRRVAYASRAGLLGSYPEGVMEFVCVRIGNFRPERDRPRHPHHISADDLVSIFERALTHPGVRFAIVFGVSGSVEPLYDLEHGKRVIGYEPKDWLPTPLASREDPS